MKMIIALLFVSGSVFAAPKAATANSTTATAPAIAATTPAASNTATIATAHAPAQAYFSTSFVGLANGNGNVNADFLFNEKTALNFGMSSFSKKEKMKSTDSVESVVDRNVYNLGASFFLNGANSETSIIINPALSFGTKKNALNVENQNGLSVRLTASKRIQNDLRMELGFQGNNLEGADFKGDIYAGVGYLF